MRYHPGMTIPDGYRVETKRKPGLYVGGAVTLGGAYLLTVSAAAIVEPLDSSVWPLYIPVVGPFIALGTTSYSSAGSSYLLVMDGLVQAAGLGMLVGGVVGKKWLVPIPRMAYNPDNGGAEAGMQLMGRF